MKTLFKRIILALALLGTTAPAQLQAMENFKVDLVFNKKFLPFKFFIEQNIKDKLLTYKDIITKQEINIDDYSSSSLEELSKHFTCKNKKERLNKLFSEWEASTAINPAITCNLICVDEMDQFSISTELLKLGKDNGLNTQESFNDIENLNKKMRQVKESSIEKTVENCRIHLNLLMGKKVSEEEIMSLDPYTKIALSKKNAPCLLALVTIIAEAYNVSPPLIFLTEDLNTVSNATYINLSISFLEYLTDAEIAFIIAHELGHITDNHKAITLFLNKIESNFLSRVFEKEADSKVFRLIKNPTAAITMLLKLSVLGNRIGELKCDHPTNHERICFALFAIKQIEKEKQLVEENSKNIV